MGLLIFVAAPEAAADTSIATFYPLDPDFDVSTPSSGRSKPTSGSLSIRDMSQVGGTLPKPQPTYDFIFM